MPFRLHRLSLTGAALGVIAVGASVLPSLVPRAWSTQVVPAGGCLAAAYAIGAFAGWAGRTLLQRTISPRWRNLSWIRRAVGPIRDPE